ncbi:glycosyltransferase family 4 protein [Chelativorans salis]|uniref:Glycosyltransferase family 4 protein n=1 Tax=Chelativorans salis TaxID=2978478 RepID=A0ABT2LQT9_9HYPH|nr:glycosyltransferase family 4 protein [Chelativorans sp. EGI FJ00035]MCT7376916.1 glycosyltransferase family 4 protein [Chelativorans sp. EGI FJ00035]
MLDRPISVCFPFIGDEIGGSHVSAVRLIQALDHRYVRPLVVLHSFDGPLADYLVERGVPFVQAPAGPLPRRYPQAARRTMGYAIHALAPLTRFLKANSIDLVHTNDGRIHVVWALPARLSGTRQVWHHRGDPNARGVNWLAPLVASHIVTVSRFAKPQRPVIDVTRKLSVIHSPFDAPSDRGDRHAARAMLIKALGCSPETRVLGYFGLLIERKRPLGFVEAVAAYARRYPDVPVVGLLFGAPGTDTPDLGRAVTQRAEALGIGERIRLMGFRTPAEPWMQAIDVLLIPAVREPFGRTVIEAMLLGTPVVATDDGGNPEAIEHGVTGLLVPPEEPERFVDPVHALLTDHDYRNRIADAARRRAFASYGVETHVRKVMAIYGVLLSGQKQTCNVHHGSDQRTVP